MEPTATVVNLKCYDHRNREVAPKLCPTCTRREVEFDIVSRVLDALSAAGYWVSEQEDRRVMGSPDFSRADLLALLSDLDDAYVLASDAELTRWVRFVFGNGGFDVISDYSVSLERVLAPVNAYAASLEP
jgi:hypothetical protein